jgi:hypothetical protein
VPVLGPHVVDEEDLAGSAGVHTGSVAVLILQFVSV